MFINQKPGSIGPAFDPFNVVNESGVYHFIASGGGIIAGKIPVSQIIWT